MKRFQIFHTGSLSARLIPIISWSASSVPTVPSAARPHSDYWKNFVLDRPPENGYGRAASRRNANQLVDGFLGTKPNEVPSSQVWSQVAVPSTCQSGRLLLNPSLPLFVWLTYLQFSAQPRILRNDPCDGLTAMGIDASHPSTTRGLPCTVLHLSYVTPTSDTVEASYFTNRKWIVLICHYVYLMIATAAARLHFRTYSSMIVAIASSTPQWFHSVLCESESITILPMSFYQTSSDKDVHTNWHISCAVIIAHADFFGLLIQGFVLSPIFFVRLGPRNDMGKYIWHTWNTIIVWITFVAAGYCDWREYSEHKTPRMSNGV